MYRTDENWAQCVGTNSPWTVLIVFPQNGRTHLSLTIFIRYCIIILIRIYDTFWSPATVVPQCRRDARRAVKYAWITARERIRGGHGPVDPGGNPCAARVRCAADRIIGVHVRRRRRSSPKRRLRNTKHYHHIGAVDFPEMAADGTRAYCV